MVGHGWLAFLMDVVGVVILGGVIVYGTIMWRRRPTDPGSERARDEATRRAYREP